MKVNLTDKEARLILKCLEFDDMPFSMDEFETRAYLLDVFRNGMNP